ncbi:hypothetical protein [Marinactinospora rubrisoli]|uniref:DUF317 domain-containing protein n=1 Tax=Marinactinospora rubrisoli TaxID=2715399 RepID=A0ABW2KN51_9ACTN
MTKNQRWLGDDGWPTDEYFEAVSAALDADGVDHDWWRDEEWSVTYVIDPDSYTSGPMWWATHGLHIIWSGDEHEGLERAAWEWVPYTRPHALGDRVEPLGAVALDDPANVAAAVVKLIQEGEQ